MTIPFPATFFTSAGYPNWNPRDKTLNISLSNASATASAPVNAALGEGVRGMLYRNSGRRYFEVTLGSAFTGTPGGSGVGIATRAAIFASSTTGVAIVQHVGASNDMWCMGASMLLNNALVNSVIVYTSHVLGANPGTPQELDSGDVIAVAVDLTNALIWFRNLTVHTSWNYNVASDPGAGTAGISIASLGGVPLTPVIAVVRGITGALGTVNVGTSAFAISAVPTGFTAWGS